MKGRQEASTETRRRTPTLAYVAAFVAILIVSSAYRPLLQGLDILRHPKPTAASTLELLHRDDAESRRQGLQSATRLHPASDAVLTTVAALAFTSPEPALRRQATDGLNTLARQQALPAGLLDALPEWDPAMDRRLAVAYARLIGNAAERLPLPANAVAFLDDLISHGDEEMTGAALLSLGQAGFYHGLDDARVATLTAMATAADSHGNQPYAADATWALKIVGQKQPLPDTTVALLVELLHDSRDPHVRQRAVWALSTQTTSRASLVDEIEAAVKDTHSVVRDAATSALRELENKSPADFDQALQTAANGAEPDTRRLRALQRLLQLAPADERVRAAARQMATDDNPVLRAGVAPMVSALPDEEAQALLAAALDDPDPQVRTAAVTPGIAWHVARQGEVPTETLERLLNDSVVTVQRQVLDAIQRQNLNSDSLRTSMQNMRVGDAQIEVQRSNLLRSLNRANQTPLQRFLDTIREPGLYGFFAFIAVAAIAVLVHAGFLVYFVARGLVFLAARRRRALTALAVVTVWIGISAALTSAFFFAAFIAGGHNSPPPLASQLMVAGVLLVLVGAYALLGFGLKRLVRD